MQPIMMTMTGMKKSSGLTAAREVRINAPQTRNRLPTMVIFHRRDNRSARTSCAKSILVGTFIVVISQLFFYDADALQGASGVVAPSSGTDCKPYVRAVQNCLCGIKGGMHYVLSKVSHRNEPNTLVKI